MNEAGVTGYLAVKLQGLRDSSVGKGACCQA